MALEIAIAPENSTIMGAYVFGKSRSVRNNLNGNLHFAPTTKKGKVRVFVR